MPFIYQTCCSSPVSDIQTMIQCIPIFIVLVEKYQYHFLRDIFKICTRNLYSGYFVFLSGTVKGVTMKLDQISLNKTAMGY